MLKRCNRRELPRRRPLGLFKEHAGFEAARFELLDLPRTTRLRVLPVSEDVVDEQDVASAHVEAQLLGKTSSPDSVPAP